MSSCGTNTKEPTHSACQVDPTAATWPRICMQGTYYSRKYYSYAFKTQNSSAFDRTCGTNPTTLLALVRPSSTPLIVTCMGKGRPREQPHTEWARGHGQAQPLEFVPR